MPSALRVGDIQRALAARLYPSVTTWNRLEARPRTIAFDRALRAEVRDALWMITKQWQMGEVRGSDAGSPVYAKLMIDTTRLTKYQADSQAAQAFEYNVPLEATVEQRTDSAHHRRAPGLARPAPGHGQAVARPDQRDRRLPPGLRTGLPDHRARPGQRPGRRPLCPARGLAAVLRGRRARDGRRRAVRLPHRRPRAPRLRRHRRRRGRRLRRDRRPGGEVHRLVRPPAAAAGRRRRRVDPAQPGVPVRRVRAAAVARGRREGVHGQRVLPGVPGLVQRGRGPRGRARGGARIRRHRPARRRAAHDDPGARVVRRACRTPAGGRSRTARPTTATSTPAPPTWPS